jgi:hypothetical protein
VAVRTEEVGQDDFFTESRWPPAAALLAFMALNIGFRIWLPSERLAGVPWLLPVIEALLLAVLLFGHPAALARQRRWLRPTAIVLVGVLVLAALWATVTLIDDLIRGSTVTDSPGQLLAAGALVWLGNNLSFALFYWLIDSGGPLARAAGAPPVDFAFTQQLSRRSRRPAGGRSSWTTCTSGSRTPPRSAPPT